jgi:hypothetical protein
MDLDLFLTILIAGLAIILSGLGGHLASTKPGHRFVFWGLGSVMFLLIIIQAQRNATTQKKLEDKIDAVQLSQQHTHIGFEPVPVIVVDDPSLLFKPPPPPLQTGFSVRIQRIFSKCRNRYR